MSGNYSFFLGLVMLVFDSILYGLLAYYFDKVLPTEYGTQLPWHFPLSCFCSWCKKSSSRASNNSFSEAFSNPLSTPLIPSGAQQVGSVKAEQVDADLSSQIGENRSLSIRNLRKVFKTTSEDRVAVDNLNLDLYEGQITCLLGRKY